MTAMPRERLESMPAQRRPSSLVQDQQFVGALVAGGPFAPSNALRVVAETKASDVGATVLPDAAELLRLGHLVLGGVGLGLRARLAEETVVLGWPESQAVDLLRFELAEGCGPGFECELALRPVEVGDRDVGARWSAYVAQARAAGVRRTVAVPVLDNGTCIGSVTFFGSDHLDDSELRDHCAALVTKLEALAAHVGVLLANAAALSAGQRTIEQLREAMVSRSVIEQAKGVLMAREQIDAETAWQYMVRISQRSHRKLRDISADIVCRASTGSFA